MRYLLFITACLGLYCQSILMAQQTPLFETTIYVRDAVGNVDSVQTGFDPQATLGDTALFHSILNNTPFDSVFDIRVAIVTGEQLFDRLITGTEYAESCALGGGRLVMIWAKYQPVTIYWNRAAFQEVCYDEGFFTPDRIPISGFPWIWSTNPNITMACASKSDSLTCYLYTEPFPYPDGSGGFDPVVGLFEVEGMGIQPVSGIYHTIPYYPNLSPCWTVDTDQPVANLQQAARVYPNPGTGYYQLLNERTEPLSEVLIGNMMGDIVRQYSGTIPESLDITGFPAGMYSLSIRWKDGYRAVSKIIQVE